MQESNSSPDFVRCCPHPPNRSQGDRFHDHFLSTERVLKMHGGDGGRGTGPPFCLCWSFVGPRRNLPAILMQESDSSPVSGRCGVNITQIGAKAAHFMSISCPRNAPSKGTEGMGDGRPPCGIRWSMPPFSCHFPAILRQDSDSSPDFESERPLS